MKEEKGKIKIKEKGRMREWKKIMRLGERNKAAKKEQKNENIGN
jgi:hypothetical protein